MRAFNPWPLVLADLRRSPIGAVAVILLVALAVGLGVAVSAQERALRVGSARAADAFPMLIGARGSDTQLVLSTVYLQPGSLELIPGTILDELAGRSDVAWAAPLGFGDSWRGHMVVGTSAAFVTQGGRVAPASGRLFEAIDEVVVGAGVDLELGAEFEPAHGLVDLDHLAGAEEEQGAHDVEDHVGHDHEEDEDHGIGPEDGHRHDFHFTVVGRLPPLGTPWDHAILAPIEAVWWIHGLPVGHVLDERRVWPAGAQGPADLAAVPVGAPWTAAELPGVPAIVVSPQSFAGAYALRGAYRDAARGTLAIFPAEVLVRLYGVLGDVRDLVATISVLSQVMVIGAILLAVLASLVQRRRLVGVVRALGASRGYVFATTWLYVALLLIVGAALGLPVGWVGAWIVSAIFEQRTELVLPVGLGTAEVALVATVIGVGVVLATIPAAMAMRGSVASALRS